MWRFSRRDRMEFRHLRQYWRMIVVRRWAVHTSLLVVFMTVAIGTLKQKRIYQGTAVLETYLAQFANSLEG